MSLRIADCISGNISFIEPFGRKSKRLSTCEPSPRGVMVNEAVMSCGLPATSNTTRPGRSYVVIVASYGLPRFTVTNFAPGPTSPPETRSDFETCVFQDG